MDALSSLLFPDNYAGDLKEQKQAGYGSPAKGTGQSMFLSQAREEDRQAGLTGLGSTLGGIIQLIAFLNASKNGKKKQKPTGVPGFGAMSGIGPDGHYDANSDPAVNSSATLNNYQPMLPATIEMMRYMKQMHGRGY